MFCAEDAKYHDINAIKSSCFFILIDLSKSSNFNEGLYLADHWNPSPLFRGFCFRHLDKCDRQNTLAACQGAPFSILFSQSWYFLHLDKQKTSCFKNSSPRHHQKKSSMHFAIWAIFLSSVIQRKPWDYYRQEMELAELNNNEEWKSKAWLDFGSVYYNVADFTGALTSV